MISLSPPVRSFRGVSANDPASEGERPILLEALESSRFFFRIFEVMSK